MPETDLRVLGEARAEAARIRSERTALLTRLAGVTRELRADEPAVSRLEVAGDLAGARIARDRVVELAEHRRIDAGRLGIFNDRLRELLERLGRSVDPCDADPDVPLVLLPVRLETRYSEDGRTLKVRIYPDEVHLDGLDRGLDPEEVEAGRTYWNAVRDEDEASRGDAWAVLTSTVSAYRAEWTALGTAPTNLDAWRSGADPVFAEPEPRDRSAAIARLLPDRFVAVVAQGRDRKTVPGRSIVPDLVAGVLSDEGADFVDVNGVKCAPGGEWMVDYDQAVAAGMAIEIDLPQPGKKVDRLIVTGARTSLDPAAASEELELLLDAHRCTRGMSIVAPGAPSNNTADTDSEWHSRIEPREPRHLIDPDAAGAADPSDGARLASALGVSSGAIDGIAGADGQTRTHASAMNAALWPTTWGSFLDRVAVTGPAGSSISDADLQAVRSFHAEHVTARGPLPTLRIGRQPYGILPITDVRKRDARAPRLDRFESEVRPFLNGIERWWRGSADAVPSIAGGGADDDVLLDILGTSAVSQDLRVRGVLSEDFVRVASEVELIGHEPIVDHERERLIELLIMTSVGVPTDGTGSVGSLETRSRILPLARTADSDIEFMEALLDGESPKAETVLQALLALAHDEAEADVAAAAPKIRHVRELIEAASEITPARKMATERVLRREATARSHEFAREADALAREVGEHGRETLRAHVPAEGVSLSYHGLATSVVEEKLRGAFASHGLVAWMRAKARLREVEEAIEILLETTAEERAGLLAETLDLASHRLDAWMTGIARRRHASRRAQRPTGATIGAYGWLMDIERGKGTDPDGGFVHAPSVDHATTAGILRSAHLTHGEGGSRRRRRRGRGGDASPSGFAIDLSSARVRSAVRLLDGIRMGQSIEALVGYRIERALHEARLDRLILTLRGIAPLVAGRLSDADEDDAVARTTIAANNVVDGVELVDRFGGDRMALDTIRRTLNDVPVDNPYVEADEWPPLTEAEWRTVQKIVADAADDLDAASDLMLAESVHQLVVGNTARASAAMGSMASGDAPPPEPEVLSTPVPSSMFAHRVMIPVQAGVDGAAAWNAARPRAAAEPALEAWAAGQFGDPASVRIAETADGTFLTLADTDLCALDVLFESADRSWLDARVRAALPGLANDAALLERRGEDWPADRIALGELAALAASLRGVVVAARPLRPRDLSRDADPAARTIPASAVADVRVRALAALEGLAAAAGALRSLLPVSDDDDVIADVSSLEDAIEDLAAYGAAAPSVEGEHPVARGQIAVAEAERRIMAAMSVLGPDAEPFTWAEAEDIGEKLFGDGFRLLARIDAPTGGDLLAASAAEGAAAAPPSPSAVRRFVRDIGSVRAAMERCGRSMMLAASVGRPLAARAVQLGWLEGPWVGGRLGDGVVPPEEPVTNLVMLGSEGVDLGGPLTGLAIDQWTDAMPRLAARGEGEDAPVDDRRATGVAINAAASNAEPPQVILLATAHSDDRWTTESLVDLLDDTLDRLPTRGVTLERLLAVGRVLPATYQRSWSLQGRKALSFAAIEALASFTQVAPYVRESSS